MNSIDHIEKMNRDIRIMQDRISDYIGLRNRYMDFARALPYEDVLKDREREKIIWVCWFQGIEQAPQLVKNCFRQLTKRYAGYKKILITSDNVFEYIEVDETVKDKWKKGVISNTAFSNIIRLELLVRYGGVWMDATVLCTADRLPDYIETSPLFVYSSWKWITGDVRPVSTWLMASDQHHPMLKAVRDCLVKYWTENDELQTYFIFHMFFQMVIEQFPEVWGQTPRFSNVPPHMMQFELGNAYSGRRFEQLTEMSDIHKLTYKLDDDVLTDEDSLHAHLIRNL